MGLFNRSNSTNTQETTSYANNNQGSGAAFNVGGNTAATSIQSPGGSTYNFAARKSWADVVSDPLLWLSALALLYVMKGR